MIKAVFFDAMGVLVQDWGPMVDQRLQEIWGVSEEVFRKAYNGPDRVRAFRGEISFSDHANQVGASLGKPPLTETELASLRPTEIVLNEELYKIAKILKAKKYIVGIISNTIKPSSEASRERRRKIFRGDIFNPILLSDETGVGKPDPAAFEMARKAVGVSYDEIFFADDTPENVAAARALGINAVLFTDNGRLLKDLALAGITLPADAPAVFGTPR